MKGNRCKVKSAKKYWDQFTLGLCELLHAVVYLYNILAVRVLSVLNFKWEFEESIIIM